MAAMTNFGDWNDVETYSTRITDTVAAALGDHASDYDLDALVNAYRDAINEALPDSVILAGNEFYSPHHVEDKDFADYPTDDDGRLDVKAVVEGVDFWKIAARHERLTAEQAAEHLGYTGASAAGSARKALSRMGVKAAYRSHPQSGRPQAVYNAREVEAAVKARPGRGTRSDLNAQA
ncbi:hypothetical protein OH809_45530 (plasmid) [Streptomyces sp. NBC_00873]|uniref:hypothetical protein n=1 Tax=Streptomyces sp. NBC_00873 TaxID=2975852 RepID=UPI0037DC1E6A|nr:hypothetical protein OH809_45530 [Streptomyces sp. NBC_00873]